VLPSKPVRIDYSLTEKGHDLASVVRAVAEWAETWAEAGAEGRKEANSPPADR
jgi:DNA-binding HxlR family transcriptional regulator